MNIKQLGTNVTLLETNHGDKVLFSYDIAVAGYSYKIGWFINSVTTSNHIDNYLNESMGKDRKTVVITELTPEEIELLFLGE